MSCGVSWTWLNSQKMSGSQLREGTEQTQEINLQGSSGLGSFFFFLPRLLPEAWRGRHVPRAGALSPFHCQDVCLHLSMSFSALSVFKWVPEKMWHFLTVTEYQH